MTLTTAPAIESVGNRIVLDFESMESALQIFSPWRGLRSRAEAVAQISQALSAVGLNVDIRVKGRSIVEIASGKVKGPILSLLGF